MKRLVAAVVVQLNIESSTYSNTIGLCWHLSSTVDEQMVSNLVSSDQAWWFWSCWVVGDLSDGLPRILGCSGTASCMPPIGASILQIDQKCNGFYIPLVYDPRCHTYGFDKSLVVPWNMVNFLNKDINVCCVSIPVCLPQVKSSYEWSRSRHKHRVYSDTDMPMLSTGDIYIGFRTEFTHMLSMLEDEVYIVSSQK